MDKKQAKGIVILAVVFVALIAVTAFFAARYSNMKQELEQRQSCTEHEQIIARLQKEIQELQDRIEGSESNTPSEIKNKAMFFSTPSTAQIRNRI